MKKLLIVLAMLGLCGCSNLSDLRNRGADVTLKSAKPADSVAQCILFGWQQQRYIDSSPVNTFMQPMPGGFTVYTDNYTAAADINSVQSETNIKLYLRTWYHRERFRDIAEKCI
ncbi:TPA: hypothetical protein NPP08_000792 [Klebsiella quasipneumoniae subsp. similipneumoniae]|nr:hypothetical protein [Klebsiella quasipneumoniae subsp. similipneumoniae]